MYNIKKIENLKFNSLDLIFIPNNEKYIVCLLNSDFIC
jgi:hypothetical protein